LRGVSNGSRGLRPPSPPHFNHWSLSILQRPPCISSQAVIWTKFRLTRSLRQAPCIAMDTRSSADADNRLDAFSGQSRSTNMAPFHMLHIVSYCAIVTLSLNFVFTIFVFKKFRDLEMGVKGHSRSLRVISFDRLCMVSY